MRTVSPIAQNIVYPLVTAIGNQVDNHGWIHLCTTDTAALHITTFSIESFVDMFLHRREQTNPAALVHVQKALTILSKRLSSDDERVKNTDANIGVALKLAASAHVAGDLYTARQHMAAVRRMVDSRGGLNAFRSHYLLTEMLRYTKALVKIVLGEG